MRAKIEKRRYSPEFGKRAKKIIMFVSSLGDENLPPQHNDFLNDEPPAKVSRTNDVSKKRLKNAYKKTDPVPALPSNAAQEDDVSMEENEGSDDVSRIGSGDPVFMVDEPPANVSRKNASTGTDSSSLPSNAEQEGSVPMDENEGSDDVSPIGSANLSLHHEVGVENPPVKVSKKKASKKKASKQTDSLSLPSNAEQEGGVPVDENQESADASFDDPLFSFNEDRCFSSALVKNLLHGTMKPNGVMVDLYDSDVIKRFKENTSSAVMPVKKKMDINTCFICSHPGDNINPLTKCKQNGCKARFHQKCFDSMNYGGYTSFHGTTVNGPQCPQHHCHKCFAENFHQRCFRYKKLISCRHCSIKFHPDCVPAGCDVAGDDTIACPRHVFVAPAKYEFRPIQCFECNGIKHEEEKPVSCTNCNRSFHQKCHPENGNRNGGRCSYCIKWKFVIPGDYVYAQCGPWDYHLGVVVKNEDYKPLTKKVKCGTYIIQWIQANPKKQYNVVSHYRTLPFTKKIWFHVNRHLYQHLAKIPGYDILFEQIRSDYLTPKPPPAELTSRSHHRNNDITPLNSNRYLNDIPKVLGTDKQNRVYECYCDANKANRCGDKKCVNRDALMECPKKCEEKPGGCQNQLIANKMNLFKTLKIFPTSNGRGFGLKTQNSIAKDAFIGEYTGEVIDDDERDRRDKDNLKWASQDAGFYTMAFGDYYVDATVKGSIMRYVNHSCDPNCYSQKYISAKDSLHICLFAKKDIEPGEELTFSYSSYRNANSLTFKCFCGAAKCSGSYFL